MQNQINQGLLTTGRDREVFGPLSARAKRLGAEDSQDVVLHRFKDEESAQKSHEHEGFVIPDKGAALAVFSAALHESIQDPDHWKRFSSTGCALHLRKGPGRSANPKKKQESNSASRVRNTGDSSSWISELNEVGEFLQREGMATAYLGVSSVDPKQDQLSKLGVQRLSRQVEVPRVVVERYVPESVPESFSVLGSRLTDYRKCQGSGLIRALPLELSFCWKNRYFPRLEFKTVFENKSRSVSLTEAFHISGVSAKAFQEVFYRSAWLSGFLRHRFEEVGLELKGGRFGWAFDSNGHPFLMSGLSPAMLDLTWSDIPLFELGRKNEEQTNFLRQLYCWLAHSLSCKAFFQDVWSKEAIFKQFQQWLRPQTSFVLEQSGPRDALKLEAEAMKGTECI